MRIIFVLYIIILVGCKQSGEKKSEAKQDRFSIEILDNEALGLLDRDAEIMEIGSGFSWTEGPLWIENGKFLLFSDIPNNKIFKIDAKGKISEFLSPSGFTGSTNRKGESGSNGLLLDELGQLVLMQHGDRRVAKMSANLADPQPVFESLVDSYNGKKLNSPNDGTFDKYGNLYFTDPPYGLVEGAEDPKKELDFHGVYFLNTSDGLKLVDDSLSRPNGIVLSTNEKQLYVAVSDPEHAVWYRYDVVAPGEVENKTLFYDVSHLVGKKGQKGLPDGMKMHSKGYLFATGPGGVWIFNESGKPIARIYTGEATSNCTFSKDEKVLFLTADDYVLQVMLK
ncbi:MAG: SMP-30/gluconolactonase/LRE family protein [Maribacter sp.]|nr:SMP-30/gluconolactonase/LRE family protein [Maribacter sp.]